MASSNSKPWGGAGAWALDAEQAEAEELAAATTKLAGQPPESFPSLKEASSSKPKKKKATAIPLSEFTTGTYVGPGGRHHHHQTESKGLTTDELLRLPTGPKERTPEELENSRLGGGFRNYGSYGGGGGGGPRGSRDDGDGSWGQGGGRRPYGGGFDEEQRRGPGASRGGSDFEQMPSRADEADNWVSTKKPLSTPSSMESGRRDRYEALGSGGGPSRADEVDSWSMGKKQLPQSRYSGFGSGFRDSSAPAESDRWNKGGGAGGMLPYDGERERPRLALDPPKIDARAPTSEPPRTRASPFAQARPREEILAEKGVDWRKVDSETETKKTSRPTSSHSSRPSSAHSSRAESPASHFTAAEVATKPRPKVNPFGDAKPREILLEEKGKDWRKIDMELEHRGINRPETEQEKLLKDKISCLKMELSKETERNENGESTQHSAEEQPSLNDQILARERDLELLVCELDDKVKFGQKATEIRPGSGAGRISTFLERSPSQSSLPEESRNIDFMDRPRSRGNMGDMWNRPHDDRRGFHRGREDGFLGNRNSDRPKSRERW